MTPFEVQIEMPERNLALGISGDLLGNLQVMSDEDPNS
jgi:hypothetical protein